MKKNFYLLAMIGLSMCCQAQNYQWQWAKTGGAINGSSNIGFNQIDDEHILDIVVDNQNNSYYLTSIYDDTPLLNGQSVTNYGGKDLLIFSTDCQGNVRWTRTIGSSTNTGLSQKLTLDNSGGIYMSINIPNNATPGSGSLPPRFGDNNIAPTITNDPFQPQAGLRTGYLLKYNTSDGNLVWRRDFQGDVTAFNADMDMSSPVIDSQGNLHLILGFWSGTHLGGLITVPGSFNSFNNYQYYLVKYDTAGNVVGTPSLLPITGSTTFLAGYLNFMYDESSNLYYIAGSRNLPGGGSRTFSYNNVPISQNAFVFSFNSTNFTEIWRKEINNGTPNSAGDYIFGLKKDIVTNDIYISGRFFKGNNTPNLSSFGNYSFTTPLTGQISFATKLNNLGNVIWCTNPVSLSDGSTDAFIVNARMPIALKGSEVLFAKGSIQEVWGTFPMVRPANDRTDPLVVRFNKDTGVVNGTYEVQGSYGQEDHFTAIAVDSDNNIMLGGFINQQLFTSSSDNVATISNAAGSNKTDFFFTKLATSATCTGLSVEETAAEAELKFYPNPVSDVLNIKSKSALQSFEAYSSTGQTVQRGSLRDNTAQVNMSSLVSGVYYVKVKTEKAVITEKVIKK